MRGELSELHDFCAHWNLLAKKTQRLGSFLQRAATRPLSLEARENDGIPRVRQAPRQMVHNSASGSHSTRGDDDARRLDVVDGLRLLDGTSEMKFVDVQRIAFAAAVLARILQIMIFLVFQIQV